MGKFLLVILVAFAGWLLLKGLLKGAASKRQPGDGKTAGPEKMVQCQQCGVFMPESESMSVDGRTSCRHPDACLHRQRA